MSGKRSAQCLARGRGFAELAVTSVFSVIALPLKSWKGGSMAFLKQMKTMGNWGKPRHWGFFLGAKFKCSTSLTKWWKVFLV